MKKIQRICCGILSLAVMSALFPSAAMAEGDGPSEPGIPSGQETPAGPGAAPGQETPAGPGSRLSVPHSGPGYTSDDEEYGPGFVNRSNAGLAPVSVPRNNFLDGPSGSAAGSVVEVSEKYSYDDMVRDIQELQQIYGDRVRVQVIGTSRDGRDIYDVAIGNENAPKQILIQGAIHARESMTPLLMMRQLETALVSYDSGVYDGRRLADMFNQAAIHFIPMSNPDGVMLSEFGLDSVRSDSLRQTILDCYDRDTLLQRMSQPLEIYLQRWKANAAGVDLNHNFPANWENIQAEAAMPSFAGYKGTAPLSEPESQALASMADRYPWAATISYHSMGNLIYWDSGTSRTRDTSNALAQSLLAVTGYKLDGSDGRGGYKDWMQSKENPVPGVTIEVGSVTCPMPVSEFAPVWQRNRAVWVQALAHVIRN